MDSFEPKKLALLRILQILQTYSDAKHPLKQEDIAEILQKDYSTNIERKAIGRNISLLKEAGFEIESTRDGSYLSEREFEDAELRLLIDSVLASRHITAKHSQELIDKLCSLSNKYFKAHVKNIYSVNEWNKTDNCTLFYNIEIIDEAIEKNKQITFDFNKYGVDKKLHITAFHRVSPYQLILNNQRYYLMAFNEKHCNIGFYRLDRITNIAIDDNSVITDIRTIDGYKNGIDYKELSSALPFMYNDKPQTVILYADEWVADQIVDWFGFEPKIERENKRIKVTLRVSANAMEYWAMQYLNSVEIISPPALREKINQNLKIAIERYNSK